MPIKRRTGKAHRLDDFHREQLMDGPDACLIAAVGYLAPYRVAQFADLSAEQQAEVQARMAEDMRTHGAEVRTWWRGWGGRGGRQAER